MRGTGPREAPCSKGPELTATFLRTLRLVALRVITSLLSSPRTVTATQSERGWCGWGVCTESGTEDGVRR